MKRCPNCSRTYDAAGWDCPSCGFAPTLWKGFPVLAPDLARAATGFRPEAYAELAPIEADNFWFRARNRLIMWTMRRHFPQIGRYLEIGCGTGYVLAGVAKTYPETRITGTEIFCEGLPYAACRVPRAELLQMDARALPYEAEFDVIGAFDVLEHTRKTNWCWRRCCTP